MAVKTPPISYAWLQRGVLRATFAEYLYIFVYAVATKAYAAWHLMTPDIIMQRWYIVLIMLLITSGIAIVVQSRTRPQYYYHLGLYTLIALNIFVATISIYTQRGMASRGVALYAIPIAMAALALKRRHLIVTVLASIASYYWAATTYFHQHPSEGYKIELYGDIAFYSGCFVVLACLLWWVVGAAHRKAPPK